MKHSVSHFVDCSISTRSQHQITTGLDLSLHLRCCTTRSCGCNELRLDILSSERGDGTLERVLATRQPSGYWIVNQYSASDVERFQAHHYRFWNEATVGGAGRGPAQTVRAPRVSVLRRGRSGNLGRRIRLPHARTARSGERPP